MRRIDAWIKNNFLVFAAMTFVAGAVIAESVYAALGRGHPWTDLAPAVFGSVFGATIAFVWHRNRNQKRSS